jgi:hypothetical protein
MHHLLGDDGIQARMCVFAWKLGTYNFVIIVRIVAKLVSMVKDDK